MKDVDYTIKCIYHYEIEDDECYGDYQLVSVFINNRKFATYDDEYHSRPNDRIDGIEEFLKWEGFSVTVITLHQNDFDPNTCKVIEK